MRFHLMMNIGAVQRASTVTCCRSLGFDKLEAWPSKAHCEYLERLPLGGPGFKLSRLTHFLSLPVVVVEKGLFEGDDGASIAADREISLNWFLPRSRQRIITLM